MKDMVGSCCVCSDDRGWPENPLVYCDGQSCTVAVHQACYGIVTVPTGPWYCRKCESQERSAKVKCELCPSKYGALKRTDNSGWAHVVCALYIPEVRFGNVTTMEPIQLQLIPQERFNKVCYICEQNGKPSNANVGACMQCNKSGCKQQFHVTCAQSLGLLCEEAGNYLDNVKYCGYCQHHYSKLKKGGNVKTIPPYKPISIENQASDSSSEKEVDSKSSALGKRKSSVGSKSSLNKVPSNTKTSSSSVSSSSYTKNSSASTLPLSGSNKPEKTKSTSATSSKSSSSNSSSAKEESVSFENEPRSDIKKEEPQRSSEGIGDKEKEKSKKRKSNSRTPTPSLVATPEIAERECKIEIDESSSIKKKKSIASTPTPRESTTPPVTTATIAQVNAIVASGPGSIPLPPSLHSGPTPTPPPPPPPPPPPSSSSQPPPLPQVNSVVVSVPLHNTSLSPSPRVIPASSPSVSIPTPILTPSHLSEDKKSTPTVFSIAESQLHSASPHLHNSHLHPDTPTTTASSTKMITSELSSGGLKITFEKQTMSASMMSVDDVTGSDAPMKRSRSQSVDKDHDKARRSSKKRGSGSSSSASNGLMQQSGGTLKKTKSQQQQQLAHQSRNTPPPLLPQQQQQQHHQGSTTFVNLANRSANLTGPGSGSAAELKESPPSSPSSESLGAAPATTIAKKRGRKSNAMLAAQAAAQAAQAAHEQQQQLQQQAVQPNKDSKENLKLFQNGVNAPHMLGNQLNLNSNMAQKMTDHLNSELEAHSIFSSNDGSNLVGPPLQHRVIASARSSSVGGSSTASGGSGLSSMLGGTGTIPQTLDQLLERQWEQGSQFLMEQAQHFDIASLLSCLHQLRAENLRLEEHVNSLLQRRDHLLAVNARLAIPLTPPATPQSNHSHTVNNLHPAVSHAEASRPRHSTGYPPHVQGVPQHPAMENGIAPDAYPHAHRSPAGTQPPQPSPRQSSSSSATVAAEAARYAASRQSVVETATTRAHHPTGSHHHRFNSAQYYNSPSPMQQLPPAIAQSQQMVIRTDVHIPHLMQQHQQSHSKQS